MVAYGCERWSLVSLVIVVWVDRRGRMTNAKEKRERERERERERIVARKKQREPLPGVSMLVRSELERVLQIFGSLCVIGLQNERKSPVLVLDSFYFQSCGIFFF